MTGAPWRFAYASVIGTSHVRHNLPCQDASDVRVLQQSGREVLVAVASDGAGSAVHSRAGARQACELLITDVEMWLGDGADIRNFTEDFARGWLVAFQNSIRHLATQSDAVPRDFACTVLAAIVGEDCAAFFQIGDGVIVTSGHDDADGFGWVFWPQQGEYANTTYFATDEAAGNHLNFCWVESSIDRVAILTDGLQPLALDYQAKSVHHPFFAPLYRELARSRSGHSGPISNALARFLASRMINDRVDDDKTLILAARDEVASCQGRDH